MAVVELDFYEPDGTTLIGTLDDADLLDLEFRPALMELGAIKFTISRHDASAALLTKRNLIKVRIPSVDAEPIALFTLKDDQAELVSKDEKGGEHLTYTGPGGLHMLTYARLDEVFYAPGQTRRGNQEIAGEWAWHDVAYGGILARIIEEGQYSPGAPLGAIAASFDRLVDSAGNPWYVIAEDFSVPTGSDVLTVANRLCEAGDLILVLGPDMILHAYQSLGDFARDLTGAFAADNVRIEKGVNLLTELNRKAKMDRITHLITRDMDQVFRTFVTSAAYEQAVYGFMDIDWTNDPDQVEKTADHAIASSDDYQEEFRVEFTPGFAPADGLYMPGPTGTDGHFWLGDSITLHTGTDEHDLNAASVVVSSMVIALDVAADDATDDKAARSLRIVPELTFGVPGPQFSNMADGKGTSGVGCPCLKLCRPVVTGLPEIEQIKWHQTGTDGAPIVYEDALTDAAIVAFGGWYKADVPFTGTWDASGAPAAQALTSAGGLAHSSGASNAYLEAFYLVNPSLNAIGGTPGVLDLFTNSPPFDNRMWKGWALVRGVNQSSPIAQVVTAQGTGTNPTSTLTEVDGRIYLHAVFVHEASDGSGAPTGNSPLVVPTDGTLAFAGLKGGIGYGTPSASWTLPTPRNWVTVAIALTGSGASGDSGPQPTGANDEADQGTAIRASRCDHVHPHSDLSDHDDETHHHAGSIEVAPFETITSTDLQSALEEMFNEIAGVTDHGALTGLADNDHPQYLLAADVPTTAGDLTTRWIPLTVYDPGVGNYLPLVDGSGNQLMAEGS